MSAERKCPSCGRLDRAERGDLVFCTGCGAGFFAPHWQSDPTPLPKQESPPPGKLAIAALHAGVLAAEIALVGVVAGLFLGVPALAVAWLAGAFN